MDGLIHRRPEYEMRLYTFSLIQTSNSFWERQEVQTEVQNFFLKNSNYEWKPKDWHKITQKVLNFADSCGLVATFLLDLKDAILNTGMKMFEWIMYVHWDFGLDITHALPILWTPLGFVDEVRIFKSIWVNDASLYVGSPEKPIFRIACMLAQEDFIREHETEMIDELKKLPIKANSDKVDLEMVNYSDKVYGIISTYVCYLVNRDWEKKDYYFYASGIKRSKEQLEQAENQHLGFSDGQGVLRENMQKAIYEGLILPPEIMAKLCGWPGLLHGVLYYKKKLNSAQKREVDDWLMSYFSLRSCAAEYNHHCRARKFWEISTLVAELWERLPRTRYFPNDPICIFLHACPLESVLWPIFRNLLNDVTTTRGQLDELLRMTFHFMEVDQYLGLPNTRYFYKNFLKKICATFERRKMQKKAQLISRIESYCRNVHDFTILRSAYDTCELYEFQGDVEYSRQRLFCQLEFDYGVPNFEIFERFLDQMFDCPDERIRFLLGVFHESRLLFEHDFDMWEKLYLFLDMPVPLRDSIDPIKCLCSLGRGLPICHASNNITNVKKCDKFIKWWHKSNEEDQKNLKKKFKESPYLSECIYKLWIEDVDEAGEKSLALLQWLFDSEYEISKFKKEKLSILGLLDTSLTLSNAFSERNEFSYGLYVFVIFFEVTAESAANAKSEIRSKIEELICKFLTVFNIKTIHFLMNWVSVSEEVKKRIFQNLMDSSKILELCEDVLNIYVSDRCLYLFYNEWLLKYCDDISKLKHYLLSKYKGLRSEYYMGELSSIYDRLERGERLENVENIMNLSCLG